jgi:hypothetical protein
MSYRAAEPSPREQDPIEGPDDLSVTIFWPLVAFVLGALVLAGAGRFRVGALPLAAILLGWHAIDHRTRRFSLSFEGDAMILRSLALGWIPVRRVRLSLAHEISFAEHGDEWEWPGLLLSPSFDPLPAIAPADERPADALFGSVRDLPRARALFERIRQRIEDTRRARAARDIDRHLDPALGDLARWWPVIDPNTITRNAWGRVASARTMAPAEHGELGGIPSGSTLRFCQDDRFRVRATPDALTAVEFSAPSDELHVLADLDPPAVPSRPGTRVTLLTLGTRKRPVRLVRFENAFDGVTFDGHPVRGTAALDVRDGVLTRCTLEEPLALVGIALPAGCEVMASTHEFIVTSPAEYTDRGRVIAPPVHLHFAYSAGRRDVPLRDILRDPEGSLRAPSPGNPAAHTAPVTPPSTPEAR